MSEIKNIIAIASGKGGVGKSTTALNLAVALKNAGQEVGLLDADIYGPNQPHMLGGIERPKSFDAKTLQPVIQHGLQTMSMGYLVPPESAMVWRGPMVMKAFMQLYQDTAWSNLDYLIIDMPPGTGDVQLTLAQKVPVTGAILVTTPQDIALLDVQKGYSMFEKVNIPVLGLIENMSVYICPNCGHEAHLFGEHGGVDFAKQLGIKLLGQIPLDLSIRTQADQGVPLALAESNHPIVKQYQQIALNIIERRENGS